MCYAKNLVNAAYVQTPDQRPELSQVPPGHLQGQRDLFFRHTFSSFADTGWKALLRNNPGPEESCRTKQLPPMCAQAQGLYLSELCKMGALGGSVGG